MKLFKYTYILAVFMSVLCLYGLGTPSADAMVIRGGENYSLEDYTMLEDDLYVGAEKLVQLSGTTTGDVFALGSEVISDGIIEEDAFLAGGTVTLSGNITGDARVVGGNVLLEGHVGEDVIIGGGSIEIRESTVIEGDLFVFADYIDFRGEVHGKVVLNGRLIEIKGDIFNDVEVQVSESLSVMNNANIAGNLIYESSHEAFIPDTSVVQGEIQHDVMGGGSSTQGSLDWMGAITSILIAVLSAVVLVFFFPSATKQMTATVFEEKPIQVLKGLLLLFFWPIASVFLMVTILGVLPGMVLFMAYIISVVIALALAPVIAGVILARWLKRTDDEFTLSWVSFGAVTFTVIAFVPVLGWFARTLIFLFAFNAVCMYIYTTLWKNRSGNTEVPVTSATETATEETEAVHNDDKKD